ncbi:MAG: hypothetical protein KME64_00185 [Scytonematopsis contorta HA4267-MV1]|jgi:hypothetical protein|nr:hypothetical protein [Scytonematopsis contorta HA4267-MV1]
MESKIKSDINRLIKFIGLATPDSLNIAEAILRNNNEIYIPELQSLREALYLSLDNKKSALLSDNVQQIKTRIIASLVQKIEAIGEVTTGAK